MWKKSPLLPNRTNLTEPTIYSVKYDPTHPNSTSNLTTRLTVIPILSSWLWVVRHQRYPSKPRYVTQVWNYLKVTCNHGQRSPERLRSWWTESRVTTGFSACRRSCSAGTWKYTHPTKYVLASNINIPQRMPNSIVVFERTIIAISPCTCTWPG